MKIFQSIRKITGRVSILAFFLVLVGCTKEDMSQCDLYLRFRYDYNMTSQDVFRDQVEKVQVFIFDKNGKYLTTLAESGNALKAAGYRMKIPQAMQGCKMVVWAGYTETFYTLPTLAPGDNIEQLTLKYLPDEQICLQRIDDLWHSGPALMSFPEEGQTTQTVSLVRNTNDFDIKLQNKQGATLLPDYKIKITSANSSYDHTNGYLPDNPVITYMPCEFTSRNQMAAQFRTLRLQENDNALLSVSDSNGRPVDIGGETTINLVNYILMSTPGGMSSQEYLDRRYQWDISLIIDDYLALAITINGWVHWFHPTDL